MKNDLFIIKGLGGKKTLNGQISVNGAKNAVLKVMAASLLFKDIVNLDNVPVTEDVKKMIQLLEKIGAKVECTDHRLTIDPTNINSTDLDPALAQSMRSSVVLTGPMLARYGKVAFPAPGGCVIGSRPIDLFVEGYRKMRAEIEYKNDTYLMKAPKSGLKGAEIFFNLQTVGGTETLMMAAVLAEGKTVLKNCAMEPEIVSVAEYLNSCGAEIKGAGTPTIEIIGTGLLESKGKPYITIPDRIEAGSFLLLGALCADNLKIKNCNPLHIESITNLLKDSGVKMDIKKDSIELKNNGKIKNIDLKSFNARTHEYPGFPTDLQAPVVTFLTQVFGESIIFETIYEDRFKFIQNLKKLGADITAMNTREIIIKGGKELKNTSEETLDSYDIRAGFATVMAALVAEGISMINNIYYIDRGYENLEKRLNAIGADIKRVNK
ncbi:MAG TPA: UDP-N-acetylglucosamine 1-carboxyvinyltransferase [Candidatus Paceibacterota bacterium]